MEPITHLNYAVDVDYLLDKAQQNLNLFEPFPNPINKEPNMFWYHCFYRDDYVEKIIADLGIPDVIKTRFYRLLPFGQINPHRDYGGTMCSVNLVLTDDAAPININSQQYHYKYALVNVSEIHSVKNNNTERLMFKISSSRSYEEVADIIRYKIS